jgi:hypothetical protein
MAEQIAEIPIINSEQLKPLDYKDTRCAPKLEYKNGSCMDLEILSELANAYNKENPKNTIYLNDKWIILNPDKYKRYLVFNLTKKINKPQTEWVNLNFAKFMKTPEYIERLREKTFRPKGPKGRFEWLNTEQIENVQKQYQDLKYTNYEFLGAVALDFDNYDTPLRNINFDNYVNKGKNILGVVFNLDKHTEPGSHWVALYVNLVKHQIYFFDSYGSKPEKEIDIFMRKVSRYMVSKGIETKDIDMRWNKVQHQKENSECGVYSMNFLLRMLRGDDFDTVCKTPMPDRMVNRCRNKYFDNQNVPIEK